MVVQEGGPGGIWDTFYNVGAAQYLAVHDFFAPLAKRLSNAKTRACGCLYNTK
ncbi:hypothetical protein FHT87_004040 [Rhizobium sp. BK316]|nr:hypothetical protein [Rhizobium sp. BK316]